MALGGTLQPWAPQGLVSAVLHLAMAHATRGAGASWEGDSAAREAWARPAAPRDAACLGSSSHVPPVVYFAPKMHIVLGPGDGGFLSSGKTTSSHPPRPRHAGVSHHTT